MLARDLQAWAAGHACPGLQAALAAPDFGSSVSIAGSGGNVSVPVAATPDALEISAELPEGVLELRLALTKCDPPEPAAEVCLSAAVAPRHAAMSAVVEPPGRGMASCPARLEEELESVGCQDAVPGAGPRQPQLRCSFGCAGRARGAAAERARPVRRPA